MDKLDKETNETHDGKSDCCSHRDLLELLAVRLGAALHQSHRVLAELARRFN